MTNFQSMFDILSAYDINSGVKVIAGIDEVGRGSLAGPIVGGCVIYNLDNIKDFYEELLYVRDSKTLSKTKIELTAANIKKVCKSFNIFSFDNTEIDTYGIQVCNRGLIDAAMIFAKDSGAELLYIDGTISPSHEISSILPWEKFPKADSKSLVVASASIIAKNYRDQMMKNLPVHSDYGFNGNVGYGAPQHLKALQVLGSTPYHRETFIKKLIVKR